MVCIVNKLTSDAPIILDGQWRLICCSRDKNVVSCIGDDKQYNKNRWLSVLIIMFILSHYSQFVHLLTTYQFHKWLLLTVKLKWQRMLFNVLSTLFHFNQKLKTKLKLITHITYNYHYWKNLIRNIYHSK